MKYRLSPSCGPRRGLGYMKICDYLSKSWAMETLKVKKYFFTRERALCTICVYLPLVYSVRKKKKKNCMADIVLMIGGRDVSRASISVSRPCPRARPRRRLQNKSLLTHQLLVGFCRNAGQGIGLSFTLLLLSVLYRGSL